MGVGVSLGCRHPQNKHPKEQVRRGVQEVWNSGSKNVLKGFYHVAHDGQRLEMRDTGPQVDDDGVAERRIDIVVDLA